MQAGMHEDFTRKEASAGPSNRSFGVTVGLFLAAIGLLPVLRSGKPRWWAVAISAVLVIAAALFPSALRLPNRLWMKLAWLLSKVTNPIITGLMFYLLFAPVAVICRWMGKDLLRLKFDDAAETYWIPRQPSGPQPESMYRQF